MSPTDGPCSTFTSNDIGVIQSNSTPPEDSLQKTGTGTVSSDFTWVDQLQKKGTQNADQPLVQNQQPLLLLHLALIIQ